MFVKVRHAEYPVPKRYAVTLNTLTKSVEFLEDHGYTVEVTCVNIAKTRALSEYKLLEAQNPVYIISAVRER